MRRLTLLVILGVGCATPYGPSGLSGGYSEMQVAPYTFEVGFRGNGYTSPDRARRFALRRSAELTLAAGMYGFFVRDERASSRVSSWQTPLNCSSSGGTTNCTGGNTQVISKPQSSVTITMVTAQEAAALGAQGVLVYDARLFLSQFADDD
jgi:hypothetical protein